MTGVDPHDDYDNLSNAALEPCSSNVPVNEVRLFALLKLVILMLRLMSL
jgi:hypothetical protein